MTKAISRRDFNGLMLSGAVAAGLGINKSFAEAAETADVDWRSDDPHLSGNYLPVAREINASNLQVISGRIPRELRGAYMRNGPNPRFKPIYYAYPMDGDGMIHAVYFENGQARYRNRFVQTSGFVTEGHAVAPFTAVSRIQYRSTLTLSVRGATQDHSKTAHSSVSCSMAVIYSHSTKQLPVTN